MTAERQDSPALEYKAFKKENSSRQMQTHVCRGSYNTFYLDKVLIQTNANAIVTAGKTKQIRGTQIEGRISESIDKKNLMKL